MLRFVAVGIFITTILHAPLARAGNDDSCDIGVAPAATLLLPYFEVDIGQPATSARTTIFTVTNVSAQPRIAHVTLWTDLAYPAFTFNVYLTPYDTQSINLYELLARGTIARNRAESPTLSIADSSHCAQPVMQLSTGVLHDLQEIFTTGKGGTQIGRECTGQLGIAHYLAIGYATIDVVATCTSDFPGPAYFASDILFDNVLIGDYELVNANRTTGNLAAGMPMVHIRAIPEGGPPGSNPGTRLPVTFYDRYTAASPQTLPRSMDRRQPLPSVFAARWFESSFQGVQTNYLIWREGVTGSLSPACSVSANSAIQLPGDVVRFDEHENSSIWVISCVIDTCPEPFVFTLHSLPATSSASTTNTWVFAGPPPSGDLGGWMYLNLANGDSGAYSRARASQNWVVVMQFAEGRFAVGFDAAALGNGCSPEVKRGSPIGPAGGAPVCPPGAIGCTPGTPPYVGTNVNPPPSP